MNNKLISVIIPIYNVEPYIKKCVQSLLDQTHPTFQAILVNDGSTDRSMDFCKGMIAHDSRFTIVNQENRGLSAARNTGVQHVSGDYVLYLDSDDALVPDALEVLFNAAKKHQADIVQGNFYYDYPDYLLLNTLQKEEEIVYTRDSALKALLEHKTVLNFAWGKLIRTSLALKHPFPEGKFFEDTCWKAKLIHDSSTYIALKSPVLYYLQRPGSISGNFSIRNLDQLDAEVERLQFLEKNYPYCVQQALLLLYSKFQLHSQLLKCLEKEEAEHYNHKLTELGNQFPILMNSYENHNIFYKLSGLQKKISFLLGRSPEWKKIRKKDKQRAHAVI